MYIYIYKYVCICMPTSHRLPLFAWGPLTSKPHYVCVAATPLFLWSGNGQKNRVFFPKEFYKNSGISTKNC